MASTTFVDLSTPIVASWLNDVNTGVYVTLPTKLTASLNLSDITNTTTALINLGSITSLTGSLKTPAGTTAQRDGTPAFGYTRANSTLTRMEWWNGSLWAAMGGGATGGGNDNAFYENTQTITTNYTLTAGMNAMTAGPITIADGITVTIPTGATWTIV